ncbi:hypothetical protein [Glycomyces xiaoerkulensis]|uniref:hypothetical protein n=1 Tax=Glycomyces xiaoerkulensis TaxID=2038139 RepID=UPI000C26B699|nr:hypothetical protein [Glycomyces xiaoerkulensis]
MRADRRPNVRMLCWQLGSFGIVWVPLLVLFSSQSPDGTWPVLLVGSAVATAAGKRLRQLPDRFADRVFVADGADRAGPGRTDSAVVVPARLFDRRAWLERMCLPERYRRFWRWSWGAGLVGFILAQGRFVADSGLGNDLIELSVIWALVTGILWIVWVCGGAATDPRRPGPGDPPGIEPSR